MPAISLQGTERSGASLPSAELSAPKIDVAPPPTTPADLGFKAMEAGLSQENLQPAIAQAAALDSNPTVDIEHPGGGAMEATAAQDATLAAEIPTPVEALPGGADVTAEGGNPNMNIEDTQAATPDATASDGPTQTPESAAQAQPSSPDATVRDGSATPDGTTSEDAQEDPINNTNTQTAGSPTPATFPDGDGMAAENAGQTQSDTTAAEGDAAIRDETDDKTPDVAATTTAASPTQTPADGTSPTPDGSAPADHAEDQDRSSQIIEDLRNLTTAQMVEKYGPITSKGTSWEEEARKLQAGGTQIADQDPSNLPIDNQPRTDNSLEPAATAGDVVGTVVETTPAPDAEPATAADGTAQPIDGTPAARVNPNAQPNFAQTEREYPNIDRPDNETPPPPAPRAEANTTAPDQQRRPDFGRLDQGDRANLTEGRGPGVVPETRSPEQIQIEIKDRIKNGTASEADLQKLAELSNQQNAEQRRADLAARMEANDPTLKPEDYAELNRLNAEAKGETAEELSPVEKANKEVEDLGVELMRQMAAGEMPSRAQMKEFQDKQIALQTLKAGFSEEDAREAVQRAMTPEFRSRAEKKLAIEEDVRRLVQEAAALELRILGLPDRVNELKRLHKKAKDGVKQLPPPAINESPATKRARNDNRTKMLEAANLRSQLIMAQETESVVSRDYALIQAELRKKLGITGFWGSLVETTGAHAAAIANNVRIDIDQYLSGY